MRTRKPTAGTSWEAIRIVSNLSESQPCPLHQRDPFGFARTRLPPVDGQSASEFLVKCETAA
jgi:hypothetical protein